MASSNRGSGEQGKVEGDLLVDGEESSPIHHCIRIIVYNCITHGENLGGAWFKSMQVGRQQAVWQE